jgi:hypothetical protein
VKHLYKGNKKLNYGKLYKSVHLVDRSEYMEEVENMMRMVKNSFL